MQPYTCVPENGHDIRNDKSSLDAQLKMCHVFQGVLKFTSALLTFSALI